MTVEEYGRAWREQDADDGRCEALREYWNVEPGRHDPHPGWGT